MKVCACEGVITEKMRRSSKETNESIFLED